MKKLSKLTLRINDIEQSDILQKKQMKFILGGYDGADDCPKGTFECICCGEKLGCQKTVSDCTKLCKGDSTNKCEY